MITWVDGSTGEGYGGLLWDKLTAAAAPCPGPLCRFWPPGEELIS